MLLEQLVDAPLFGEGRAGVVQLHQQATAFLVREQARRLVARVRPRGHCGEHAAVITRYLPRLFFAEFYGSIIQGQLDAR